MAITKKIESKLKTKTLNKAWAYDFLLAILEKEESGGQYKKKYEDLLEKAIKEEVK